MRGNFIITKVNHNHNGNEKTELIAAKPRFNQIIHPQFLQFFMKDKITKNKGQTIPNTITKIVGIRGTRST